MKMIQSYWSKPLDAISSEGHLGGWSYSIFHYMSVAYSCLKYREFYEVELITDKKGKKILIDDLGLPYTSCQTKLDDINDYPPLLWAMGKIYTYSLQNEPFLHVDNDTFIWSEFPLQIMNADIVSQHLETNYGHNNRYYNDIEDQLEYIPEVIREYRKTDQAVTENNAGIIGGKDIRFFKEFAQESISFVDRNFISFKKLKSLGMFNTIFEQYLFYCMAKVQNKKVTYLLENIDDSFKGLTNFYEVPYKRKFIHTLGPYKTSYTAGEHMVQRFWYEYPEYYKRIIKLFKYDNL